MSVYVDPLVPRIESRQWPYRFACHMVADTEFELHAMARKVGLPRGWHQAKGVSRYVLPASARRRAVELGAIPLDRRTFAGWYSGFIARKQEAYA